MKQINELQLQHILDVFREAGTHNKFTFIKGGWNIDLHYGKPTRTHDDIDFIFDIIDKEFWKVCHYQNSFSTEIVDEFYSVYRNELGIVADFEGVSIKDTDIIWKHGGVSPIDQVVERVKHNNTEFLGMKLNVEKYLKEKGRKEGKETREKDTLDVEIIDKLLIKKTLIGGPDGN